MNQTGIAPLIVLLSLAILLSVVGGGYYFINLADSAKTPQNKESSYEINPSLNIQVSPLPSTKFLASSTPASSLKPDLVIEKITYKNAKVRTDSTGMPAIGPGKDLDFTITVKNIGNADFTGSLYVFNSRSETDFAENYHSHSELANQKEEKIPVNGLLDVTVSDSLDYDTKNVQFSINHRSKTDKKDVPLAIKDELNYENNSYQLTIN